MNPDFPSLNIKIGSRVLPVSIKNDRQRTVLLKAETRINQKIEWYKNKYTLTDESLLFALLLLDVFADIEELEAEIGIWEKEIGGLANELEQAIQFTVSEQVINPDASECSEPQTTQK